MTDNSEKTKLNLSKDNLALIVGGLFVLGIVFSAYTYFNKGSNVEDNIKKNAEKVEDIISSNTVRDENGEVITDGSAADEAGFPNEIVSNGLGTGGPVGGPDVTATWNATDYKQGDINGKSYTVKDGDTLWEIAEAVYGNGADWVKILGANTSGIGFLADGSQALIVSGQVLVLP
ncbi:MAG: hypothetical protein ACD_22C00026G0001 [uncultured bacterium]|nr:MAG: hypothetical protein ACD_22C00026G0001 [uncultured bacterium]